MSETKVREASSAITALTLRGFKSFPEETRIEIAPLTLFAGVNSSGKSSAMQPFLLMKQTEEASYDPGPLKLDGPYVHFTGIDQIFSKNPGMEPAREFAAGFETKGGISFSTVFVARSTVEFEIESMRIQAGAKGAVLHPGEFAGRSEDLAFLADGFTIIDRLPAEFKFQVHEIVRERSFLEARTTISERSRNTPSSLVFRSNVGGIFQVSLRRAFHVPGLRGNPERSYPRAAIGDLLPGPFASYVASLIAGWEEADDDLRRPVKISAQLSALGLAWGIRSHSVDATRVELQVGMLPTREVDEEKVVNIADVGFGVSQVLPVLVALQVAGPGELVYIEQPELHLHPRAQQAMAGILVEAAKRGVRVVAETHSSTLLLAVQTLVAQGTLDPSIVKLHWFRRDERGASQVSSADLDELGAYGDWPEDFGEVDAQVEGSYLTAVEQRAFEDRGTSKRGY